MRAPLGGSALDAVLDPVLSVVFPARCPSCARALERPLRGPLCEACWARVPSAPALRCRCGKRIPAGARCGRCRRGLEPLTAGLSLGPYEGPLKAALHELKYRGRRRVARRLALELVRAPGARTWFEGDGVLVPVPLHPRRERERGFNQAGALAAALAAALGLDHEQRALVRRVDTPSQTGLSAQQRRRNVATAFAVRRRARIAGRSVVLVDDVTTTGATARACARALLAAGATEVKLLAVARVE
ncbi:MAG TPA: phosphoribosyltransferase family protein [Vicinamibacteria bacterium]|nr:phosphoribosyltransferase family protein [Vicinamibacteria bacterium]